MPRTRPGGSGVPIFQQQPWNFPFRLVSGAPARSSSARTPSRQGIHHEELEAVAVGLRGQSRAGVRRSTGCRGGRTRAVQPHVAGGCSQLLHLQHRLQVLRDMPLQQVPCSLYPNRYLPIDHPVLQDPRRLPGERALLSVRPNLPGMGGVVDQAQLSGPLHLSGVGRVALPSEHPASAEASHPLAGVRLCEPAPRLARNHASTRSPAVDDGHSRPSSGKGPGAHVEDAPTHGGPLGDVTRTQAPGAEVDARQGVGAAVANEADAGARPGQPSDGDGSRTSPARGDTSCGGTRAHGPERQAPCGRGPRRLRGEHCLSPGRCGPSRWLELRLLRELQKIARSPVFLRSHAFTIGTHHEWLEAVGVGLRGQSRAGMRRSTG